LIGTIETDLTFLIENGEIEPQLPSVDSKWAGSRHQYWEVHYAVLMIVEGRSIRFEARWPASTDKKPGRVPRVLATKLVGIAASFPPGTA
jgi:hypothetical protein